MEVMPYQDGTTQMARLSTVAGSSVETDWRKALPVLTGKALTLREVRISDAPSLLAMLSSDEASRFISPPPSTVDGFERFIAWSLKEREAGRFICFAIVPEGMDTAVGLFQVRQLDPAFTNAEWGFALGSAYWGTGLFAEGAEFVLDFVFGTVGARRLEARATLQNGRGNGALRKIGAYQEGLLRASFLRNGEYYDQVLWAILASDREQGPQSYNPQIH
jgi:ribosomal-protein-alanine N-acetyltransferase